MIVTFWGTRGTIPVPGPDTVRYGGNTACVSIETEQGALLIFDAGTGIRNLGKRLLADANRKEATLFLSHSHWDHIQGFPLFSPAYDPAFSLTVLGSPLHRTSLQEILTRQQDSAVFPVPLDALHAALQLGDYCMDWADYSGARILTIPLIHPGGSCGFRVEENGRSVVFMTDNELPDDEAERSRFVEACRGADLLIHDAQYTDSELEKHRGWGHSSDMQSAQLAIDAGVARLALFHHNPDRTDDALDEITAACRAAAARLGSSIEIFAASEGRQIII